MLSKPLSESPQRFIFPPPKIFTKPFFEVPQRSEMDRAQGSSHLMQYFTRVHSKGKNFYECNSCRRAISSPSYFKRHLLTHVTFNENQNLAQNFEKSEFLNQVRCKNCSKTFHYQKAVKHMVSCHKKKGQDVRKNSPATSSFEREHNLPFQRSPSNYQRNLGFPEEDEPDVKKKIKEGNIGNSSLSGYESTSLLNQMVEICKRYRDTIGGTSVERKFKMELKIMVENYYAIMENESRSLQKTIQELEKVNVKGDNEILRKKVRLLEKADENLLRENRSLKEINKTLAIKVAEQAREIEECKKIIEERSLKIENQDWNLALYMKNLEMLRTNYEEEVEMWEKKYRELLKMFVEKKENRDHEIRALLKFAERSKKEE